MAITPQEHADYMAAYSAWRVASEAFEDNTRRALRGEEVDATQIALDVSALKRLHMKWLEKSLPLTRFKRA